MDSSVHWFRSLFYSFLFLCILCLLALDVWMIWNKWKGALGFGKREEEIVNSEF